MLQTGYEGYRYEREVEEFLRYSPSVRGSGLRLRNLAPGEHADGVAELSDAQPSA
jgi:hypothetical protein